MATRGNASHEFVEGRRLHHGVNVEVFEGGRGTELHVEMIRPVLVIVTFVASSSTAHLTFFAGKVLILQCVTVIATILALEGGVFNLFETVRLAVSSLRG